MKRKIKRFVPSFVKRLYTSLFMFSINLINSTSPVIATKLLHHKITGRWIGLDNPKDFNEKLQWLKLNEDPTLKAKCADKYELYNYVREVHDETILNRLYGVFESTSDIDWDLLPKKFAMKCTHGCGYNVVTDNKDLLDKEEVFKKIDRWLRERYSRIALETHYDLIKPRIIVEEYIENEEGMLPIDYKIYCFNGEPRLILVCSDREHGVKLDFFDLNWEKLHIGHKKNESKRLIKKPTCLNEMLMHSRELAKPFKFVRIDFYDKDGKPVLGELTFTPAGNMANYYNDYGLKYLGELLSLEKSN